MRVHLPFGGGVTLIENTFIDQHMSRASGEFVKIYLYIMRRAQSGQKDLTVSQIADFFDDTEADVKRALNYWEKQGLLSLSFSEDGELRDIRFSDGAKQDRKEKSGKKGGGESRQKADRPEESGRAVSREESGKVTEFPAPSGGVTADSSSVQSLLFVAEQYICRPLTVNEQNTLIYFLNGLHMSEDLVEFLLEYCVSKGHKSFHYIEKVALNWSEKGIRTVEEARSEVSMYRKEYYDIFKALGISGRNPTDAECEIMDRWMKEYAFPMDVIYEACSRTVLKTSRALLKYADSILTSWHDDGVKSLKDIERLDEAHAKKRSKAAAEKQNTARPSRNRFNNFTQRDNDWDEITRLVVESQRRKSEG